MFLWRHVPIYRKSKTSRTWRLNKFQSKPAQPVRVEAVRPHGMRVAFRQAVITPDGFVHPFRGKYGRAFVDFWNEWRERYQQVLDYQNVRGIPPTVYCPRCDEPMNWIGRKPAKWVYVEVEAKRRLYDRVDMEKVRQMNMYDDDDDDDKEDEKRKSLSSSSSSSSKPEGHLEDRYCCPKDECGIREARVEYKHNCRIIKVLDGLTDKQWNPTKFKSGRKGKIRSQNAKARLAEIPFLNRGWPTNIHEESEKAAPYLNSLSHEKAKVIVEQRAKVRYERRMVGKMPKFDKRPSWYKARNNFRYSKAAKKPMKFTGSTPCDECNEKTDKIPSVCFSCGFILCKKCREKHFPKTAAGEFGTWGECPGCSKKASKSLDMKKLKNHKQLRRLIEQKPNDPRKAQWLLTLGNAYWMCDKPRAADCFREAGNLGLLEGYGRLGDFYVFEVRPPDFDKAKHYYELEGEGDYELEGDEGAS